jgi:Protein metal binding site.
MAPTRLGSTAPRRPRPPDALRPTRRSSTETRPTPPEGRVPRRGGVVSLRLESDCDGDGWGPSSGDCNESRSDVYPGGPEICDGLDNDCDLEADEARCEDFDANGDGVVDVAELARIGRAFALCSETPATQWWSSVDYTRDGCISGDDLAILGVAWKCTAPGRLCP